MLQQSKHPVSDSKDMNNFINLTNHKHYTPDCDLVTHPQITGRSVSILALTALTCGPSWQAG